MTLTRREARTPAAATLPGVGVVRLGGAEDATEGNVGVLGAPDFREVSFRNVLVVSTVDAFSSPFVATLLAEQFMGAGLATIRFESAGTRAVRGTKPSTRARELASTYRADIGGHLSRPLGPLLIGTSDLILCMTEANKEEAVAIDQRAADRTLTLLEFARVARHTMDVHDDGSPAGRWESLVATALREPIPFDIDTDIPSPRSHAGDEGWAFEEATVTAIVAILRRVFGA